MKKKRNRIITVLAALLAVCITAACEGEPKERITLSAPGNYRVEGRELIWDEVENAEGYLVEYAGEITETKEAKYWLDRNYEKQTFTVRVKAYGDESRYGDSEWSEYEHVYEAATEALQYRLLDDGTYEVLRANRNVNAGLEGRIVIPDYYNEQPVTRIAENAFSVDALGVDPDTGRGCNTVTTEVRLPKYLRSIGENAFDSCISLRSIEIPEGVTSIERSAFACCLSLEKFNIPSTLTEISNGVFARTSICAVIIPETVTKIGARAFSSSKKLEKVELPDALTQIGEDAFYGCENLKEIRFPDSLTKIGSYAFSGCSSLTEVTIGENVREIESYAFSSCSRLASITIGNNVARMEEDVFEGTAWYESQPEGFVLLREDLLYRYKGETREITSFPAGVKYVAGGAFRQTGSLERVDLSGERGIVFLGSRIFASCDTLTEIRLPADIKELTVMMVAFCHNLEEIVIPKTVEMMDSMAIYGNKLKRIYYEGTQEEFEAIERNPKGSYGCINGAEKYYYSETEPAKNADGTGYEGNYWHYGADGSPVIWRTEET